MKTTIIKNEKSSVVNPDLTTYEVINIEGSLFEVFSKFLNAVDYEPSQTSFKFSDLKYVTDDFVAEWNEDLSGYVVTFADCKVAHTQTYIESQRRHADFKDEYIQRYTEYDDELSKKQVDLLDDFIKQVNKIKRHYS